MNNPIIVFISYAITAGIFYKIIPIFFIVVFLIITFIILLKKRRKNKVLSIKK